MIGALLSRIRSQETPRLNPRARDRFPGHVYNEQQRRLQGERKFRDWDGWLELVDARARELREHPLTG